MTTIKSLNLEECLYFLMTAQNHSLPLLVLTNTAEMATSTTCILTIEAGTMEKATILDLVQT